MTRTMLQIGDLDSNDQLAMTVPSRDEIRAARREQTERRLGYAFLVIVSVLGFAVFMASAGAGTQQVAVGSAQSLGPATGGGQTLFNSSMSELFDVSRGVRRL